MIPFAPAPRMFRELPKSISQQPSGRILVFPYIIPGQVHLPV